MLFGVGSTKYQGKIVLLQKGPLYLKPQESLGCRLEEENVSRIATAHPVLKVN